MFDSGPLTLAARYQHAAEDARRLADELGRLRAVSLDEDHRAELATWHAFVEDTGDGLARYARKELG